MEWKKIACRPMEYGKIVFHSIHALVLASFVFNYFLNFESIDVNISDNATETI